MTCPRSPDIGSIKCFHSFNECQYFGGIFFSTVLVLTDFEPLRFSLSSSCPFSVQVTITIMCKTQYYALETHFSGDAICINGFEFDQIKTDADTRQARAGCVCGFLR